MYMYIFILLYIYICIYICLYSCHLGSIETRAAILRARDRLFAPAWLGGLPSVALCDRRGLTVEEDLPGAVRE